jgi:hypothetical protein
MACEEGGQVNVRGETVMILNLRNAAVDHKMTCSTNCNVSLGGLYRTALYIYDHMYRLSDFPEEEQLVKDALAEMKELH